MFRIEIIAIGRMKSGPLADLVAEYDKRINWPLKMIEIEIKKKDPSEIQRHEAEKICSYLKQDSYKVIMDERGESVGSLHFSKLLEKKASEGKTILQFVLGGADGLTDQVRAKADKILSFGQQTWPHMLARIMLLEQIYRTQQIIAGHPYHRE